MNFFKKLLLPLALVGAMENCSTVESPSQEGNGVIDTAIEMDKEQIYQLLMAVVNGEGTLDALTAEQVELLSQGHGSYYCDSLNNDEQRAFDENWRTQGTKEVIAVTGGKVTIPESGAGSIKIEDVTAVLTRQGVRIVGRDGVVTDSVRFTPRDTSQAGVREIN